MMTNLDDFLSHLADVKRSGVGYIARCPAHADHNASLSIHEGDDGRILLHDFGGCTTAAVLAALGLSFKDLFPPPQTSRRQKAWRR